MDYLNYFGFTSEPFSNAPLSRFYFASQQHTDALERLRYMADAMKGLAILIGDIGLGKTTLARRMLESLPEEEFEAAMLVIVHAGITPNWLLKRIAIQLGVPEPAEDKLSILSQLYQRLVQIYEAGKRAVVLIDEAQMLATRDLMEEFRGLLNLEVPERKLISFIFFGLPEIERNLRLDPPLAQRIAIRYHLQPLGREDTLSYVEHRLRLAGNKDRQFFGQAALDEIYSLTRGVPRLVNTLCDNLLLELFLSKKSLAERELVLAVADNLGFGRDFDAKSADAMPEPARAPEPLAVADGPGHDAVVAVDAADETIPAAQAPAPAPLEPDEIARQVAGEPMGPEPARAPQTRAADLPEHAPRQPPPAADLGPPAVPVEPGEQATTVDIEDPLAFLEEAAVPEAASPGPSPWENGEEIEVDVEADDVEMVDDFDLQEPVDNLERAVRAASSEQGAAKPPAAKQPTAKQAKPKTKGSKIDLDEIDALLADLNLGKK